MKEQKKNERTDLKEFDFKGWGNEKFTLGTPVSNDKGIFKGKVVSETGHRVFGAIVELVGTGKTYITSPTGYFKMTDIPEGVYLARFTFPGFEETDAIVTVFGGEEIDMTMEFKVAA